MNNNLRDAEVYYNQGRVFEGGGRCLNKAIRFLTEVVAGV